MDKINFGCSLCGNCCSKNIRFNLKEIFEYVDKFVFAIRANYFMVKDISYINKNDNNHLSKIGYVWQLPEKRHYLYFYIDIIAIKNTNMCSQLNNNLCNLQIKKPSSCKLSPVDILSPEINFYNYFHKNWFPLIEENKYKCNKDKTIYQNSVFEENISDLYYNELLKLKDLNEDYFHFFLSEESILKNKILNWINILENTVEKKNSEFLPLADLYIKYLEQNYLTEGELLYFIENQNSLIKKMLKDNNSNNNSNYYYENKFLNNTLSYYEDLQKNHL